jgi:hypothetical protein
MKGNEKRETKSERRQVPGAIRFSILVFRFSLAAAAAGCTADKQPTTRPMTAAQRQEAALADPFGYSPMDKQQPSDISGGKIGELDRGAMKKDIDHVFNP